jgi:hypothetical protein
VERIGVPLALDDMEVLGSEVRDGVLEVEIRSTFPAVVGQRDGTASWPV